MDSSWQMEQPDKMSQYDKKECMEKLAAQGHKLATDILTYASLIPTRDPYTLGLAGTISTAAIALSSYDAQHQESGSGVEENTIRALCRGVKAIFDRVETALRETERLEEGNGDAAKGNEGKKRGVNRVEEDVELVEKLGGFAEADPLHWRLEDLRGYLVMIFDSVRYLGLKKEEKE